MGKNKLEFVILCRFSFLTLTFITLIACSEKTNSPITSSSTITTCNSTFPSTNTHDPSHLTCDTVSNRWVFFDSGDTDINRSLCPLGHRYLEAFATSWTIGAQVLNFSSSNCDNLTSAWPAYLQKEIDGGTDFDAPGVFYSSVGNIPDKNGNKNQIIALYYSRYYAGEDTTGQACLGRMTASSSDASLSNLIWESDDVPVLCSNSIDFQDPSKGRQFSNETTWKDGSFEALALDADIFTGFDGHLYMVYGSHGPGYIRVVKLDANTGRLDPNLTTSTYLHATTQVAIGPMYDKSINEEVETDVEGLIEAPFIFPYTHNNRNYYYLFVNWFRCCSGGSSTYRIYVGRSTAPSGPYYDKNSQRMDQFYSIPNTYELPNNTPGGTEFVGPNNLASEGGVAAGHAGVTSNTVDGLTTYYFSFHYYTSSSTGANALLGVRTLTFDSDGWPVLGSN